MIPERPPKRVCSGQAGLNGKTLQAGASVAGRQHGGDFTSGFVTLELADGSKLTLPAGGSVELTRLRQFRRAPR